MCIGTMLLGKAIGGRTGAIIGGALGAGIPGAFAASQIFGKKKTPPQGTSSTVPVAQSSFGG
jgi:hypothetical protein